MKKPPSQRELRRRALQRGEEPKGGIGEAPITTNMGIHEESKKIAVMYSRKLDNMLLSPDEAVRQAWWFATLARRLNPEVEWPVEGKEPMLGAPNTGKPN